MVSRGTSAGSRDGRDAARGDACALRYTLSGPAVNKPLTSSCSLTHDERSRAYGQQISGEALIEWQHHMIIVVGGSRSAGETLIEWQYHMIIVVGAADQRGRP